MQECRHCHVQQLDGTIFCAECGASMIGGERLHESTSKLNYAADQDLPLVTETKPRVVSAPMPGRSPQISLVVINSGRQIQLEVTQPLLVGRKDNQRKIYPDVDLGLDGGYDAGVSRRHAIIAPAFGGFTIEDLASANGTFVNGQRLDPQIITPLNSGDEVQFGTLILRFELE